MYRDDPLDDEAELRDLLGDEPVDRLLGEAPEHDERTPLLAALDVLRVLQGWIDEEDTERWFTTAQARLEGHSPVDALAIGWFEDVEEAARRYVAANS